jgi:hypothetical protein
MQGSCVISISMQNQESTNYIGYLYCYFISDYFHSILDFIEGLRVRSKYIGKGFTILRVIVKRVLWDDEWKAFNEEIKEKSSG